MGVDAAGVAQAEERVLALASTSRDATLIRSVLTGAGIQIHICERLLELCAETAAGASALLLPEEAMDDCARLEELLAHQPSWSDLPVLLLTGQGADSPRVAHALAKLGNVTLIERPTRVAALVSAVRTALRARSRQYQIRKHLTDEQQAAEALREASRRKDEFLAMLAHELRNPLAPIRNSLHLLREAGDDLLATATIRAQMERQVDIIVRLVDDLLEVHRITRGQIGLRLETVDLARVLDNAVETCRPAIELGGHELSLCLPSEPLLVEADPLRLAQVFSNLLNNAAKYTDRGGRIAVTAEREADGVRVSMRDTGIGIRPEMLTRVFEMFTQADGARDRAPGGLGIGLSLVRHLVDMHGGRVEAQSDGPGRGSEFIVHLPLATAAAAQAAPAALPGGPAAVHPDPRDGGVPQSVLVVDDNRDAADSLAMLLRFHAASVHVAYSGADALELLARHRPTVALLDIGMPQMSGYELAARIRSRPELQSLVLIALTGWGQDDDRRRSREAGFDHHLVKPVDPRTLQTLLGSLRRQSQAAS